MIPFALFFEYLRAMETVTAHERFELAMGTAHGTSVAQNGKDPKVRNLTRRLTRRAYPEVDA